LQVRPRASLPGTNAVAYYKHSQITLEKSFVTLGTDAISNLNFGGKTVKTMAGWMEPTQLEPLTRVTVSYARKY